VEGFQVLDWWLLKGFTILHDSELLRPYYIPVVPELQFLRRLVETNDLRAPLLKEQLNGPSLRERQAEMKAWLKSIVHGDNSFWTVDGAPTEVHFQAIFYGFSNNPERIESWMRSTFEMSKLFQTAEGIWDPAEGTDWAEEDEIRLH